MERLYNKIKPLLHTLQYYILILLGLTSLSWLIWARFLRERTIRDVPDGLFTEFRFWVLLYICCIYMFVIKNLVRPKNSIELFVWLSNLFFTPLTTLDHFIKYNNLVKPYYSKLMFSLITNPNDSTLIKIKLAFFLLDISPRIILVSMLLLDTFYFNTIELFYKIVLIGILPFLFRYLLYSIKDLYNRWIDALEEKYDIVYVFEKGYEWVIARKRNTLAIHHYTKVSIKQYIEIKHENILKNLFDDDFPYEYVCSVLAKTEVYETYKLNNLNKYADAKTPLTLADSKEIKKLFEELMPKILDLKSLMPNIDVIKQSPAVKWPKVVIFSLYFLCWSFILVISYYVYPIKFDLFKYFCTSVIIYLTGIDDPFSMLNGYSMRENLITVKTLKLFYEDILERIFK